MIIDFTLKNLRSTLRKNSKKIIDKIILDYVIRENGKAKMIKSEEICMFCGTNQQLTKEHVIPKWLIDGDDKKYFTTTINGIGQTYNRTTISACALCNNNVLNNLEKYINTLFENKDLKTEFFDSEEVQNIIRWLEIIEYKFQLLNIKRKFLTSKSNGFIPYLADFPISMLRLNKDYTPSRVVSEIRSSQKRITVKNKTQELNSLILFKTSNTSFHFFHTMNDFIFIELPKQKIAMFYFFDKKFDSAKIAYSEAMKIIKTAY